MTTDKEGRRKKTGKNPIGELVLGREGPVGNVGGRPRGKGLGVSKNTPQKKKLKPEQRELGILRGQTHRVEN